MGQFRTVYYVSRRNPDGVHENLRRIKHPSLGDQWHWTDATVHAGHRFELEEAAQAAAVEHGGEVVPARTMSISLR